MDYNIKLAATDIDGTFVRSDYTYDTERFHRILERMEKAGCVFAAASGNQYYQLRDLFPDCHEKMAFVAENGAYVRDRGELVFAADMPRETAELMTGICGEYPEMSGVLCGLESAYCQRGAVSPQFFEIMKIYFHRLKWTHDFRKVKDQILKFTVGVPEEKTQYYFELLRERLKGIAEPTTSGHGSIDVILPGCHKASGLKRLAERWGITPEQCAAFGDGGNDIEMLQYCGCSFAVSNASPEAKAAAKHICPSNEEDGVLATLDRLFPSC